MTIKSELQQLTSYGRKLQNRTEEGKKLFDSVINKCKKAALGGKNVASIDLVTVKPNIQHRDKIKSDVKDLTDIEQELYSRLDKEGFVLSIVHYDYKESQSGPYGEDEYTAKTSLKITW